MNRILRSVIGALIVLTTASFALADRQIYDIRDFDAKAGGESLCTKAIQDAIDKCAGSGGGTIEDAARPVPEKPTNYPESTMFGTLPAYGFYCRHVKNLRFQNIRLATSAPDYRHAVVFDDVQNAAIDSLDAPLTPNAADIIRLIDSTDVRIDPPLTKK
jgi:hypothetical protein